MAVGIEIKANSVKFQLKLPVGTELGKKILKTRISCFHLRAAWKFSTPYGYMLVT